jgi:carbamoyl-phosphate synthase large subunit
MRIEFDESLRMLMAKGYNIAATPGTAQYYTDRGYAKIITLAKPPENSDPEDEKNDFTVLKWIANRKIELVINVPEGTMRSDEVTAGYKMRRCATDFGTSLLTNIK